MGESYLPHSVLHEKVRTLRKLFVHLVHRPKVIKSQESYRPDKTQSLCDPWSRGWALFPTGLSTRLEYSTASQTATESCEDTINHVPDKKSGGTDGRDGALWRDFTVIIIMIIITWPQLKQQQRKYGTCTAHSCWYYKQIADRNRLYAICTDPRNPADPVGCSLCARHAHLTFLGVVRNFRKIKKSVLVQNCLWPTHGHPPLIFSH